MVDALLVFNPLQGFFFFVLRSPCDDLHRCNTSVTSPTLAVYNRLASLLRFHKGLSLAVAGWFHSTLPRLALAFARLTPLTLSGSSRHSLTSRKLSPFLTIAPYLFRPLALRRFVPTA